MDNKETLINHIEDKVPKLRFPEFIDSWDQRKFGDLGSISMCKRIFKEQTSKEGDVPFYKIGTFGNEPDAFIAKELFEEYKNKFPYPEVGDLLISASGTIGRTVEYKGENAYFQDSNIIWFKHDDRVDNSFLKCIYSFVKWAGIEGSTIKRLYNDNFLKTEFWIPQIEEQQKIGYYFNTFDHLITLHQNKLNILNKYKRGLLFKIFTSFNRDNLISLKELIDKNVIEIKRGNIIPKQYGIYPVYSSSVHNNGLFCYSDNYMFDEELVSWSIDGGGNFFYRPKHKFSLTNVSGYIRVKDKNILNTQYLYYNLDYSSCNYNFDYQNKALPSYISKLYQIYLLDIKIQNKVSTILSSFDFIIKKEEQILLQLKQYKQGLLQQMFI